VYILSSPYKLTPTTHTVSGITTRNSGRADTCSKCITGSWAIPAAVYMVGFNFSKHCQRSALLAKPGPPPYHSLPYRLSFRLDSEKLKINKNCDVGVGSILGLSLRENKLMGVFKSRSLWSISEQLRT
jgi:hypothetical protein